MRLPHFLGLFLLRTTVAFAQDYDVVVYSRVPEVPTQILIPPAWIEGASIRPAT
jgi:hypothetical protein